jgi:hypothetical protein
MSKLLLSGHETFHCRTFWLKKGYDFVQHKHKFTEDTAVVELGVGKNMVRAIKYWLTVFNIIDKNEHTTQFGDFVFGKYGVDPYLEETTTLWLLHSQLVTKNNDSLYSLFFNEFRKERTEFTQNKLLRFIQTKCKETNDEISENTINDSISILLKTYLRPGKSTKSIEDDFTSLLIELELIKELDLNNDEEKDRVYRINVSEKTDIPSEIILFSILDNPSYTKSISFRDLVGSKNSIGNIFAISPNGVYKKIEELSKKYPSIVFKDDAGVKELQFKKHFDSWQVLKSLYEN